MTSIPRSMFDPPEAANSDDAHGSARKLFAARLFRLMTQKGWNQAELARRAGLNRAAVNKYISGRSLPSPESLNNMAQALGISPLQLLPPGALGPDPAPAAPQVSLAGRPDGRGLLTINAVVPMETALQVLALVHAGIDALGAPSQDPPRE